MEGPKAGVLKSSEGVRLAGVEWRGVQITEVLGKSGESFMVRTEGYSPHRAAVSLFPLLSHCFVFTFPVHFQPFSFLLQFLFWLFLPPYIFPAFHQCLSDPFHLFLTSSTAIPQTLCYSPLCIGSELDMSIKKKHQGWIRADSLSLGPYPTFSCQSRDSTSVLICANPAPPYLLERYSF